MPASPSPTVTYAPLRLRSARILRGNSGFDVLDSRRTNRTSITALATRNPVTFGDDQPDVTTFVQAYTSAASAPVTRSAPGRSKLGRGRDSDRASTLHPPTAAMSAIGRFTYRHQRQERYCVSAPPSSIPIAAPLPAIEPYTANAVARSRASVNEVASRARAVGASSAANAPCAARAATRAAKFGAAPPAREARAKPA